MEKLPDDVVWAILARVTGIRDLFRCAVTCKRWRRLIADASFLRRRWPEGVRHPSSLIGFFAEQRLHDPHERLELLSVPTPMMPPSFVPAPWSPLGRPRPYSDVVPDDQFFQVSPLGSRHGLLLVRLIPRDDLMIQALHGMTSFALHDPLAGTSRVHPPLDTKGPLKITGCAILTDADRCLNDRPCPAPAPSTNTEVFTPSVRLVPQDDIVIHTLRGRTTLALYDPLAGTSRVLPPLTDGTLIITGCAILTDADRCSNDQPCSASSTCSALFKVMIIGAFYDGDMPAYKLCTFTSSESTWSKPEKLYGPWVHRARSDLIHADAVVCQGMAHWLFKTFSKLYALEVSVETDQVSFTKLPDTLSSNTSYRYSGASLLSVNGDGKLLLLSVDFKFSLLEIWTRQGDNMSQHGIAADWLCTKTIRLNPPQQRWKVSSECISMGEMTGALLLKDSQACVHILDLQTGAMETVQSWFGGVVVRALPFEMDWPAFFMSRLAGGSIERTRF